MNLKELRQVHICGEQNIKCERERNDHMLNYEQMFGNVFERMESKCCEVLMKHCRKVKVKQVITDRLTDDQDRVQSVYNLFNLFSDTDSEFTECQTPRKKFH